MFNVVLKLKTPHPQPSPRPSGEREKNGAPVEWRVQRYFHIRPSAIQSDCRFLYPGRNQTRFPSSYLRLYRCAVLGQITSH